MVVILSVSTVLIPSRNDGKKALVNIRKKFSLNAFSDHIIYLTAFNEWQKTGHNTNPTKAYFCRENLISNSTMELISGIKQQLFNQLRASGFVRDSHELNRNSLNWSVIKAALCAGAYPKLIRFDENRGQFLTQKDKIRFHQSSQLMFDPNSEKMIRNRTKIAETLPSDWLIYEEMILIGRTSFAKCVTSISPITVALFCGPNYISEELKPEIRVNNSKLQIDDWIAFTVGQKMAQMVTFLRKQLHNVFVSRIDCLSKPDLHFDDSVIDVIIKVLNSAEIESGFKPIDAFSIKSNNTLKANYFGPKYQVFFLLDICLS